VSEPAASLGEPVLRREDARLLRGEGRFVADIRCAGALHAAFVRSPYPHAILHGLDGLGEARAVPGVVAVLTAADVAELAPLPVKRPMIGVVLDIEERQPYLAGERVRFAGEPVALVVADDAYAAADAAAMISLDAEPLPAVTDVEAAADGTALLFPQHGTNVAREVRSGRDDPLAGAAVVVRARLTHPRLAPVPLETSAILAEPDGDGLVVHLSTQSVFDARAALASALGLEPETIRVIAPDVGGGFGPKLETLVEHVCVAHAARLLGRPVRYAETRGESMLALPHGRGQVQRVAIGATGDGTITGLDVDILADLGAYPLSPYVGSMTLLMLSGAYAIPAIRARIRSVVTNATPTAPLRGAGRPEAAALVERAVDLLAAELGLDPVTVRRRNLVRPDAFPYRTAVGSTYDSGEYERALDRALALADIDGARREQAARRGRGDHRLLGIGVACYVEITTFARPEHAAVTATADGAVEVAVGVSPQGQGHETAFAQVASATLGVPLTRVRVVHSDTARVARGLGTFASRSLQVAGSAVMVAAQAVDEQARLVAAGLLEADAADVTRDGDRYHVRGAPEPSVTLAAAARGAGGRLAADHDFTPVESTFPFGSHAAVVELDTETGDLRVLRLIAVDDAGRIVNPLLAEGQVHGGVAQGLAQALYEAVAYDLDGNPLTADLVSYRIPSAADLPWFLTERTETPSGVNPLGAKGIGESGAVGATPAVWNAAVDALAHLGVRHLELPLTPERLWRASRRGGADLQPLAP
jgi:carbon-monoxide dehydrogenase large subunit